MTFTKESKTTEFVKVQLTVSFYDLSLSDKLDIGRKVSEKYGSGFEYIGATDKDGKAVMSYMKK